MALAAALPTLLVSGVVPSPWDAILAACNAALAVLTGTNRPASSAERAQLSALAAARKSGKTSLPPVATLLALCAFLTAGCLGLAPMSEDAEIAGLEPAGEAEPGLTPECRDLDNAYLGLQITGTILSGVGGAGGAVLALWPDPTREELIGVGVATAGSGIIGSGLLLGAGMVAQRFVDRCTGGP